MHRVLKMVVKFLCSKQGLFRFVANVCLKRNLSSNVPEPANSYKYFLILDFEATCEERKKITQEIIEFPCLKVNWKTLEEEARFHYYVRPIHSPVLSDFCIRLTGILQEMVDNAPMFPEVYEQFEAWREKEGLTAENSLYVTSGDWDLGHMIKVQCNLSNLERPPHMQKWADLKKVFGNNSNIFYNSFADILKYYGLTFEGRLHSGIDDCLNMLRVIRKMVNSGIEFKPTSKIDTRTLKVINCDAYIEQIQLEGQSKGSKVVG